MLSVDRIGKTYGDVQALRGVSFSLERGSILALLGPNGAGKTTLLSIVAGVRRPDTGCVLLDGEDPRVSLVARAKIGFAPQDIGIYPQATVRENITYFARLAGIKGRRVHHATEEAAEALGIAVLLDRRGRTLSGGQKRCVHLAMALVSQPDFLLVDEPTAGLDVETRSRVVGVVCRLAEHGSAVLYSTHYFGEVEQMPATILFLAEGQVLAEAPVEELVRGMRGPSLEEVFLSLGSG
jgi:ABC-2 type transport system ATP-binding protein